MNCGDFRYLIQRRFDVELTSSDDRALLIHLETCESCQKFYHQVQQVIIAAEEMSLADDLLPPQPDSLSSKIFLNIPHQESGILAAVSEFFSHLPFLKSFKKTGVDDSGQNNNKDMEKSLMDPVNGNRLRHLSSSNQGTSAEPTSQVEGLAGGRVMGAWGAWSANQYPDSNNPPLADLVNRADVATDTTTELVDEQRATRSLGEKFSRFTGQTELTGAGSNQPLTLADSIRRRIAEMPKVAPAEVANPDPNDSLEEGSLGGDVDSHYDAAAFGAWGVPHSPDFPKINSDVDLGKMQNNLNNVSAPNSWGKAEGNWNNNRADIPDRQPIDQFASGTQQRGGWIDIGSSDPSVSKPIPSATEESANESSGQPVAEEDLSEIRHWSQEAEQLETGSWQTVELESEQLGTMTSSQSLIPTDAVAPKGANNSGNQWELSIQERSARQGMPGDILPQPAPELFTKPVFMPDPLSEMLSGAPSQMLVEPPSEPLSQLPVPFTPEPAVEIPPKPSAKIPAQPPTDLATRLQNAVQGSSGGPKIYSVVSKHAKSTPAPFISKEVPQSPKEKVQFPMSDAPVMPESTRPTPVNPPIENSHLFHLDDPAIDKLFSENLGIHERSSAVARAAAESATAVSSSPPSLPASPPQPSFSQPQLSPPAVGRQVSSSSPTDSTDKVNNTSQPAPLFAIDDMAIDRIFSQNLGVPKQVDNVPTPLPPPAAPARSPDFASMSTSSQASNLDAASIAPPPREEPAVPPSIARQKITGVDRLDSRAEPIPEGGSGRIAAIGKFLLDNKDLEKIGKITASDLSDRGMRTLSLEAHRELSNLLKQIDSQVGVIGTMIVGHDGLLIANTVPPEMEAESLSKWAQAIYMGTAQVIEQLGNERVRQIVSQTERGYLIIANFGAGLLISCTNPLKIDHLLPLMRTITQLVAA